MAAGLLFGFAPALRASDAPFTANGDTYGYIVEGQPVLEPGDVNDALYREVTPGYFEAVEATLREGHFFEDMDREEGCLLLS
jgi:hypothetical protein